MGRVGLRAAARSPRKPHCVQHDPGASRERVPGVRPGITDVALIRCRNGPGVFTVLRPYRRDGNVRQRTFAPAPAL